MVIRASGMGAMLLVQLLLARLMGVTEYGVFAYALAWMMALGTLGAFGMQNASARYVAAYTAQRRWSELAGFLRFRASAVTAVSLCMTLTLAGFAAWWESSGASADTRAALWVAALGTPVAAHLVSSQGALRGFHRQSIAEMLDRWIRTATLLVAALALYAWGGSLSGELAISAFVFSTAGALAVSSRIIRRVTPAPARTVAPSWRRKAWLQSGFALMLMSSMQLVLNRLDVLMLGAIVGPAAAGIYMVVSKLAELTTFALSTTNTVVAPMISEYHVAGNRDDLQRLLGLSARIIAVVTTAFAVVFWVLGEWGLSLFGEEFKAGYTALLILIAGQVFNGLCGPVGFLATMTGHERWAAANQFVAAALNVLLNSLLIPRYGMVGAALATATSMAVWNLSLLAFVRVRLRLNPTIFSGAALGLRAAT
jgi:O-antigen/teichoic acid export membrane protein